MFRVHNMFFNRTMLFSTDISDNIEAFSLFLSSSRTWANSDHCFDKWTVHFRHKIRSISFFRISAAPSRSKNIVFAHFFRFHAIFLYILALAWFPQKQQKKHYSPSNFIGNWLKYIRYLLFQEKKYFLMFYFWLLIESLHFLEMISQ